MKNYYQSDRLFFTISYFSAAKDICDSLLLNTTEESFKKEKIITKYKYIPATFIVKHGIEICIKGIWTLLDENYKPSHNIAELFTELKKKIAMNKKISNKKQRELTKKQFKEKGYHYLSELCDKETIQKNIESLEKKVFKYFHLDIMKEYIGKNFSIDDTDNTALKYPENNLKCRIDYYSLIKNIEISDIKELLGDIEKLISSLRTIYIVLEEINEDKTEKRI